LLPILGRQTLEKSTHTFLGRRHRRSLWRGDVLGRGLLHGINHADNDRDQHEEWHNEIENILHASRSVLRIPSGRFAFTLVGGIVAAGVAQISLKPTGKPPDDGSRARLRHSVFQFSLHLTPLQEAPQDSIQNDGNKNCELFHGRCKPAQRHPAFATLTSAESRLPDRTPAFCLIHRLFTSEVGFLMPLAAV
jgi:hypothetical protein